MTGNHDSFVIDNYDDENLADVLEGIEQELAGGGENRQLFTMMLRNEYHEADITAESRDIVTQTLFR